MTHELKLNGLSETAVGSQIQQQVHFGCRCGADSYRGDPDHSIPNVPDDASKAVGIACSRTGKRIGAIMDNVLIDHRGQQVRKVFTVRSRT